MCYQQKGPTNVNKRPFILLRCDKMMDTSSGVHLMNLNTSSITNAPPLNTSKKGKGIRIPLYSQMWHRLPDVLS